MRKIKAAVIGTGFIGPTHIEAIRRLGFAEVVAISGSDLAKTRKKADELNIGRAYDDYRLILEDPEIEVVHNCTPNHLHYQVNRDSILAGKHILSEKPLTLNSAQSGELLKLVREKGVIHGVNFNYRQYPLVQQLRQLIKEKELGQLHLVHGSYLQDWLLYDTDFNWRLQSEVGGKLRAIADIGSHWYDTVQHVIGQQITEVFADLATAIPTRKRSTSGSLTFGRSEGASLFEEVPIDTEDFGTVLLKFNNGIRGVFTVSQISAGRKNRLSFEVDGSTSSSYWNQEEPEKLWRGYRDQPNQMLLADPALLLPEAQNYIHYPGGHNQGWPDGMKNMMNHFYSAIRDKKDPMKDPMAFATFEDGHRSMCVLDAILESYQCGKWVKVCYDA